MIAGNKPYISCIHRKICPLSAKDFSSTTIGSSRPCGKNLRESLPLIHAREMGLPLKSLEFLIFIIKYTHWKLKRATEPNRLLNLLNTTTLWWCVKLIIWEPLKVCELNAGENRNYIRTTYTIAIKIINCTLKRSRYICQLNSAFGIVDLISLFVFFLS